MHSLFSPAEQGQWIAVKAPAKINWFLHVEGKRGDGYHDIRSVLQCVSLFDELTLEHADSIVVESTLGIPYSENLVVKAAWLLKEYASYRHGARIVLEKCIPVSAGLGGGSSDAASVLIGLNRLWRLGLSRQELCSLGARLGSDVSFFFYAPAAAVSGRGEVVEPLNIESSFTVLLVKPDVAVSAAEAYRLFDTEGGARLTKKAPDIKLFCQTLRDQDFRVLSPMLYNDLEGVIARGCPAVMEIKHRLNALGADLSLMSGSGPTVFGIFRDRQRAEASLRHMQPHWCFLGETLSEVTDWGGLP